LRTKVKLTNITGAVRIETVESSDVSNSVKRDTHGDLKLSGGKVDAGNHLGGRMLDLETRVELEEEERVVDVGGEVGGGSPAGEEGSKEVRKSVKLVQTKVR